MLRPLLRSSRGQGCNEGQEHEGGGLSQAAIFTSAKTCSPLLGGLLRRPPPPPIPTHPPHPGTHLTQPTHPAAVQGISSNVLAELFEAVVGAVHVDGGLEAVRGVCRRAFPLPPPEQLDEMRQEGDAPAQGRGA